MRRKRGRALRRRYGRAHDARRFQVVYQRAGSMSQALSPVENFGTANRAAIEMVRSGRTKRASVVHLGDRVPNGLRPEQVLAEYGVGPGGGVITLGTDR